MVEAPWVRSTRNVGVADGMARWNKSLFVLLRLMTRFEELCSFLMRTFAAEMRPSVDGMPLLVTLSPMSRIERRLLPLFEAPSLF